MGKGTRCRRRLGSILAIAGLLCAAADLAAMETTSVAPIRYDSEYPAIHYTGPATANSIARLQERLERGELKLAWREPRGYLDAILRELDIPVSSQVLVYSKTSLQFPLINGGNPRALYFGDDAFVGWVRGSDLLEFAAMDAERGLVFYSLLNRPTAKLLVERENNRCLTCHDTFSMTGGGVPRFMVNSSIVDRNGSQLTDRISGQVTDRTPIAERWGGWYVTGGHGDQQHLGNLQLERWHDGDPLDLTKTGNLRTLAALFDTQGYAMPTSDIVALLVMEHQSTVYNLITRLNFKARTVLAREGVELPGGLGPKTWEEMSPRDTRLMRAMMEPLVRAMLFAGAAPLSASVTGSAGYERDFTAPGPRDSRGRSLRDLDLRTRLFRYPLSYLVYSAAFDALPFYATDYVYRRFAEILGGVDGTAEYAHLSAEDRRAILAILLETKPAFRPYAAQVVSRR
jgi:hypothetical protein